MILSYKEQSTSIPGTSSCIICSKGVLNDGDIVEVTSPLFPSIDYNVKTTHLTKTLSVVLKTDKPIESNGSIRGELNIDDDDIFNMYVVCYA